MVFQKRILVHDYSGHPFQVQLSRALARKGHEVLHLFSASFQTPKGNLQKRPEDPENFDIAGLSLKQKFEKDSFFKRRSQEVEIGQLVAGKIRNFRPDIVISSNAPLDTQACIYKAVRSCGARFVFWLQDIYSEAISRILPRKLPVVGNFVAARYHRLEYSLLCGSDHIVSITEDFLPILTRNGISSSHISVIENWAPLGELEPLPLDNDWARVHMPAGGVRAVYSGTLGYKHDPNLLIEAARVLPGTLYVFSEGRAAETLAREAAARGITNIEVRPWVPFTDLAAMLSGADILIAMIEKDAGIFSVPSKVLTYLCSGRPILAAIPPGNLAGRIIDRENAGLVSSPGETEQFISNLKRLSEDAELRRALGANGRAYAEAAFDIDRISDRFEQIFEDLFSTESQVI